MAPATPFYLSWLQTLALPVRGSAAWRAAGGAGANASAAAAITNGTFTLALDLSRYGLGRQLTRPLAHDAPASYLDELRGGRAGNAAGSDADSTLHQSASLQVFGAFFSLGCCATLCLAPTLWGVS